MALTKKQQEFIGVYGAVEAPKTPFYNYFTDAKQPHLALSNSIRVDEVVTGMSKAGIIPRGAEVPAIKVNGHSTVTVEPNIIGGSVGISALDSINAEAGELVVVNGQAMKSKDFDRLQKIKEIKASIENTKEDMAARVFITGKVKDLNGNDVDLGLKNIESKTKGTAQWTSVLTNLVMEYYQKNKKYPDKVVVGAKVADSIIAEINSSQTPQFTSKVNLVDGGIRIELAGFVLPIETFPANDIGEDTSTKVTLYQKLCLVPVFAGLEYIGTTGSCEMVRADIIVDQEEPNKQTGQAKLFGKSAPFPLIILPNLFRRYNFTDLA